MLTDERYPIHCRYDGKDAIFESLYKGNIEVRLIIIAVTLFLFT